MKIMVLAGGYDQIALIKGLKKRGHTVYLVDYLDKPQAASVADRHFQISTLDVELVYELAQKESIDLITTACTDQALLTVAIISERMGLPCYVSSEIARNVTNKLYMKNRFFEKNIKSASFRVVSEEDEMFDNMSYPIIVKPCDCNSSKGVTKAYNESDFSAGLAKAFEMSRSKKAIVEDYIEGTELSVDAWRDAEGVKIIGVSGTNKLGFDDRFTIFQSVYPVDVNDSILKRIADIIENIYLAFGINDGPMLAQLIVRDEEIFIVEICARMGGGSKCELIQHMTNVDIMDIYINRVLGNTDQIIKPEWSNKRVENNYIYAYNGRIKEIVGIDELLNKGVIKDYFIYKNKGDCISGRETSSDRVCGFMLEENSEIDLNKARKEAISTIDILDENNRSIMYKECW